METKALDVILTGWRQNKGTSREQPRAEEANSETRAEHVGSGARKARDKAGQRAWSD